MRVLQVLPELNSGGVERGTLEIAQALVKAGHDAWVISAGGRLVEELESLGATHIRWPLGTKRLQTLGQIRPLRRWLQHNDIDIVHARSRLPAWICWLALRGLSPGNAPHFITTVHGLHSVNRYSAIMTWGERVIAVSNTVRDYIGANYPQTPESRIRVIHRGIDPDWFYPDFQPDRDWLMSWHQQYPALKGRFVVTLPGRITRLKGHLEWLDLISDLKQHIPELAGLIVGDTDPRKHSYAREVERKVARLELDDTVFFTGYRADMREIYHQSDIVFALSNQPESFGRSALEPLAMGRPVIGWDQGGVGEILTSLYPDGRVTPSDQGELIETALRIYRGNTGCVRPNQQFLVSRMQSETLDVYRELML